MIKIPKRFHTKYKRNRFEYTVQEDLVKIPSVIYPLNNTPEVFVEENTELIIDNKILQLIDSICYKIGHCYTNAESVCTVLNRNGYKAEVYVGWYINADAYPMHHSWVILQGKYLIDISDEYDNFYFNIKQNKIDWPTLTREEQSGLLIEYMKVSHQHKNSERCHLGKASCNNLYVGSKCSGKKGKSIFNELICKYPNHPCVHKGTDSSGKTPLQSKMEKEGLL